MFYCTFPIQSLEEVAGTIIICAPRRLWFSCIGTFWGLCRLGRISIIKCWRSRLTRQLRLPCRPKRLWKELLITSRRQDKKNPQWTERWFKTEEWLYYRSVVYQICWVSPVVHHGKRRGFWGWGPWFGSCPTEGSWSWVCPWNLPQCSNWPGTSLGTSPVCRRHPNHTWQEKQQEGKMGCKTVTPSG